MYRDYGTAPRDAGSTPPLRAQVSKPLAYLPPGKFRAPEGTMSATANIARIDLATCGEAAKTNPQLIVALSVRLSFLLSSHVTVISSPFLPPWNLN